MDSVGIPNLFCSSIDSFVTGVESTVISPDKIFRISKRRSRDFLDSSCGISGEASFGIPDNVCGSPGASQSVTCRMSHFCDMF